MFSTRFPTHTIVATIHDRHPRGVGSMRCKILSSVDWFIFKKARSTDFYAIIYHYSHHIFAHTLAIACRRHCSSVFHGYRSKVLALGFGDHLPRRGVGPL